MAYQEMWWIIGLLCDLSGDVVAYQEMWWIIGILVGLSHLHYRFGGFLDNVVVH